MVLEGEFEILRKQKQTSSKIDPTVATKMTEAQQMKTEEISELLGTLNQKRKHQSILAVSKRSRIEQRVETTSNILN